MSDVENDKKCRGSDCLAPSCSALSGVRVRHYFKGRYVVEYKKEGWFKSWKPLLFWFDSGHPGGTECYSTQLWRSATEAEKIALTLKTELDVALFHAPEVAKEQQWKKKEEQWWKDNAPYEVKNF